MKKKCSYIYPGDHLCYPCGLHYHHGIYCGDIYYQNKHYTNVVIHFESKSKRGQIVPISYEKFSQNHQIYVITYKEETCYDSEIVIQRAINKLGEPNYNLFGNNCEHFAHWCKTGKNISAQVNRAVDLVAGLGIGLLGGLATTILLPIAIPDIIGITGYAGKLLTLTLMDFPNYKNY